MIGQSLTDIKGKRVFSDNLALSLYLELLQETHTQPRSFLNTITEQDLKDLFEEKIEMIVSLKLVNSGHWIPFSVCV